MSAGGRGEPGSLSEPGSHQALAVLGIALIAMGEDIGAEMTHRIYSQLVFLSLSLPPSLPLSLPPSLPPFSFFLFSLLHVHVPLPLPLPLLPYFTSPSLPFYFPPSPLLSSHSHSLSLSLPLSLSPSLPLSLSPSLSPVTLWRTSHPSSSPSSAGSALHLSSPTPHPRHSPQILSR